jgi:hypothetical protein
MDCALGYARRPRGVADDGGIVDAAAVDLLLEVRRVADLELPSGLLQLLERHEEGLAVRAQAARVVVHDRLEPRAPRAHVQELVDLLLVLDDREAGLRVVEDVFHLLLDPVLVERHRHAAERLGGEHRPVELRAVVADDGDLVAATEAEGREPQGDQACVLEVVAPGVGLPDPVVLLPDGDAVAPGPRVLADEPGKRLRHVASGALHGSGSRLLEGWLNEWRECSRGCTTCQAIGAVRRTFTTRRAVSPKTRVRLGDRVPAAGRPTTAPWSRWRRRRAP